MIPEHMSIPSPVEDGYVEEYFTNYLLDPKLEPNETYRYSSYIAPGVQRVIEQLKNGAGTNQATISVGGWTPTNDVFNFVDADDLIDPATGERDPPCLRCLDFRLDRNNKLHLFCYFRSWDLWGGLPANLAALELLREYVGMSINSENGKILAASKGLHLYSHSLGVASQRVGEVAKELGELINVND
jgi:thymidylate synthase